MDYYNFLVKNNEEGRGAYWLSSPEKGGGGNLFEMGGFIQYLHILQPDLQHFSKA